jgi:hypothetical protein
MKSTSHTLDEEPANGDADQNPAAGVEGKAFGSIIMVAVDCE